MKEVHMSSIKSKLLRRTLFCNAIFSLISGIIMLAAAGHLANLLGEVPPLVISLTGGALIVFALWLLFLTRATKIPAIDIWSVIIGDLGWVLASAILMLAFTDIFTESGLWIVGGVAVVVLTFADLQYFGLRQSAAN